MPEHNTSPEPPRLDAPAADAEGHNLGGLVFGLLMAGAGALFLRAAFAHDPSRAIHLRGSAIVGPQDGFMIGVVLSWYFVFGALLLAVGLAAFGRAAWREYRLLKTPSHAKRPRA